METTTQKIGRFCNHLLGHVSAATREEVSSLGEDNIYSRMILCTTLDAVSKIAFPTEGQVRKRFVDLVRTATGWADCDRVSLVHLVRAVSGEGSDFSPLRSWAMPKLHSMLPTPKQAGPLDHGTESYVPIAEDPTLQDVQVRWPKDTDGSPVSISRYKVLRGRGASRGVVPAGLTHAELLYQYRNRIVHEMLVPGRGWDAALYTEPHYHLMTEVDRSLVVIEKSWELVYPLSFLATLCSNAIRHLQSKLTAEARNPLDSFKWGSYWLGDLN